jgi:hypothetical protein
MKDGHGKGRDGRVGCTHSRQGGLEDKSRVDAETIMCHHRGGVQVHYH